MKRFLLGLILLGGFLFSPSVWAYNHTIDSLVQVLDKIIQQGEYYDQQYRTKIDVLENQLKATDDPVVRFSLMNHLFDSYRSYNVDSAYNVAKRMLVLSESLDSAQFYQAQMRMADALNKLGKPSKCISILNSIPRSDKIVTNKYFYYLMHSAYLSLSELENNTERQYSFKDMLQAYKDTVMAISKTTDESYLTNKAGIYALNGEWKKGIALLRPYYDQQISGKGKENAIVAFELADMYLAVNDTITATEFYIRSSIADLKAAKHVYKSLSMVAILLYRQGDITRAYNYITKAMGDINDGHARYRVFDITESLPIITESHKEHMAHSRNMQWTMIGVLAVFLLVFCILNVKLRRKKKIVADTIEQVKAQNIQLRQLTDNLKEANARLMESDRIKEEYIALLFNTCSEYIREQEEFRKKIARGLASNQIAELTKVVNSHSTESDNFREFIRKFDSIFHSIFPNFVKEFNSFLRPEEQIILKSGEFLTPELRIYALIRLGITENNKIADFLHYSVQTVYNYRQRMRNKAIIKGENLAEKIMNITE